MPPAYPRRNKSLIRSICLQLTFLSLALLIAGCGDYISATADLTPSPNSTGGQPTPLATTPAMLTQPVPSAIQPGFTTSAHPGHLKPVTALVYTPDGKKLISASEDATIKIWEVSSGKLLNTLKGHTEEVEVLAISPNGHILASGGRDNMLKLWDLTTGKETATLRGHSELITSLAISPDGQTLASADYKGLTRLWELPDGKEKAVLKNSFGPLAFSPDGKLLATGGTTNEIEGHNLIRFIDLATNQEKFSLKTKGVSQLVFSPDGKMLVTASNFVSFTTASTLQLWEFDSGKELASVEEKLAGTLAISPDGQTLAIGGNIFTGMSDRSLTDGVPLTISLVTDQVIDKGAIKLKELATLKDIASFPVQDALINTIVFSPDGKTLTSGSWNNSITFWQIPSGKQTGQIAGSPGVKALAITSDQKLLASGGDDGNIRLLNAVDGTEIRLLKGHSAKVSTVAFSPDGKILASGSKDDTARLWEVSSGKLLATLKGHDSWVNKLAFSPDGKLLATASSDTTLKLWEVASAKELKTLKGHPHAIWDVSFSPDGKTLVSAGNGKEAIFFWEVASGTAQPLKISTGEAVVTVAYSPDGKTLAGIGEDGAIKLWEVASGKEVSTLQGPLTSGSSYSRFIETGYLSFSPDGRTLLGLEATSYRGTILKLWEVALSRETFSASYNQSPVVEAAVMTPDGKRVVTGQKDGSFKLFQLVNAIPAATATATLAATAPATVTLAPTSAAIAKPLKLNLKYRTKPGVGHSQDIKAVTYSPDGKLLASTDGLTLQLWEAATQKPVANWDSHGANSLSFSPDGKWLAGGGSEKTATIWETATGKELVTLKGHTHSIRRVAFSPDGKMLATSGGNITEKDDNTVRLWDTTTGKELFVLSGHTSLIDGLAFSPDGRMLVTGDWDSKIFLWDPHTGQRLATPVINFPRPLALAFSPDGKWLAGSSFAGLLTVWDMTTSRQAYKLAGHTSDIRTLAFSADSRWLASGDGNTNGTIRLWDLEDGGKLVTTLPSHTSIVHTVAFSPDGKTLASGGGAGTAQENDNAIKLWEIPTGKDLGLIKGVENDLYALFIHPDGQSFFSLGMDGVLKRRELVSGKELFSISLGYLGDGSVAFSPDGKLVALAGRNEKVIYLYELASGKRVNIFAGQIGSIGLFRFSPDSRTLVSVSNNGGNILKFWDVASGQELLKIECPPNYSPGGLVFSQDGKTLASGGITYGKGTMAGTVKLWETATGKELASFEAGPKYNSVVGFTPDGKTLISVMDTSLIFWDVAAGQVYRRINSSNDKNYWAVNLSSDGRLVAARAGKELKLWDVASGSEVYSSTLNADLSSLYFTPDDKMLLAAFADGSLSLWEITS